MTGTSLNLIQQSIKVKEKEFLNKQLHYTIAISTINNKNKTYHLIKVQITINNNNIELIIKHKS